MADFFTRLFRGQESAVARKKAKTPENILAQMEVQISVLKGLPSTRARRKTIEELEKLRRKIKTNQEHITDAQQVARLSKILIRPNRPTKQLPLSQMALDMGLKVSSAQARTAIGKAAGEARSLIVKSRLKSLQARRRAQRGR